MDRTRGSAREAPPASLTSKPKSLSPQELTRASFLRIFLANDIIQTVVTHRHSMRHPGFERTVTQLLRFKLQREREQCAAAGSPERRRAERFPRYSIHRFDIDDAFGREDLTERSLHAE